MSHDPLFPATENSDGPADSPAVELIRAKVARAYAQEPDAVAELTEIQHERVLSKHQRFMKELSESGKSLAEIQTAWHHYYVRLTNAEKHQVWQEFYEANQNTPYQRLFQQRMAAHDPQSASTPQGAAQPHYVPAPTMPVVADHTPPAAVHPAKRPRKDKAAIRSIKRKVTSKISAGGKLTAKHHLQSLGFGLLTGTVVLVMFLFTFFNQYIIAPFIQPSRNVSNTPIILGSSTASADTPPSVTVPKINIQIPVDFALESFDESAIENRLESGVVHYPSTVLPGQNGNGAYFGHSSGNIFNNGKYKFAFTLLHDLTTGDLFYITYGGKTYAYQIFAREVVPPSQVSVIHDTKGKQATATLITCDPPGLSTNRLVLWGEQISPNPSTNTAPEPTETVTDQPTELTGNGPSLWSNFVEWMKFWD